MITIIIISVENKNAIGILQYCIMFLLILSIVFTPITSSNFLFPKAMLPVRYHNLHVEELGSNDTCFQGTSIFHPMEWWYFDAMFDNGYSVEFHMNLFSTKKHGFIVAMMNFYKDGELINRSRKIIPAKELYLSKEKPLVMISDNQVMTGCQNKYGNWIFNVTLKVKNLGVDLTFYSSTPGWKSKILRMWWWAVVQPKAIVNGTISIDDQVIAVNGTGYQEHGWDGNHPFVKGWYWGKFSGDTLNIIWSDVIKYPWRHYLIMVLNEDKGDYVQIPAQNIQLEMSNYTRNDGWRLPTCFKFKVDYQGVKIDITSESLHITHQISFGIFNYWRYHVKVQGYIAYGEKTEYINKTEIMDWTRFW
jgi:hypothetical protein